MTRALFAQTLLGVVVLVGLLSFVFASGRYNHTFPQLSVGSGVRNLAALREGVRVEASSSEGFGGASPAPYALDGDLAFGWTPEGWDTAPWLRVTFREAHTLTSTKRTGSLGAAHVVCLLHGKDLLNVQSPAGGLVPFTAQSCDAVEWRFSALQPCVAEPSEHGGTVCRSHLSVRELEAFGQ